MKRFARYAVLAAIAVLFPIQLMAQNYVFGPNVRVNDDSPGVNWHQTYSPGQHLIACRGDTVYLVWRDDRDPNCASVYFARSNNGGQSFLDNIRLNGPQYSAGLPSLALDGNGGIHVCWLNCESIPGYYVYYSKSTDGGQSFSIPIRACDSVAPSQVAYPSIAVSRGGRYVYVARAEAGDNGSHPYWIMLSRSIDGGTTFLTPDTRISLDTAYDEWNPTVAVHGDSVVLVAWDNGQRVAYAKSPDAGATFGHYAVLSDSIVGGVHPSIAVDSPGRVYVAWGYGHNGVGITVSSNGGDSFPYPWWTPNSLGGDYPSLCASDSGQLFLAWTYWGLNWDVQFSFSSDGGSTFTWPVDPSDRPPYNWAVAPCVTANEQGRVFIAWSDGLGGSYYDVYCASGGLSAVEEPSLPSTVAQSYEVLPNPTRGPVRLTYSLYHAGHVSAEVIDLTGRQIAVLTHDFESPGRHLKIWSGHDSHGRQVSSGIYFVRLKTPDGSVCRKVQVTSE